MALAVQGSTIPWHEKAARRCASRCARGGLYIAYLAPLQNGGNNVDFNREGLAVGLTEVLECLHPTIDGLRCKDGQRWGAGGGGGSAVLRGKRRRVAG